MHHENRHEMVPPILRRQARSRGGQRRSASHRHTSVPVHACVHQGAATASTSAHWSGMCFPLTARARPRVGSVSEHATCRPAYSNPAARAPLSCSSTAYGHRMRVWRVRLHLLPTGAGAGGHLECAGAREGVHARSMEVARISSRGRESPCAPRGGRETRVKGGG
jgi:hypothetical protein